MKLFYFIIVLFSLNVQANEQKYDPPIRFHITGELTLDSYRNFEAALKENPKIRAIEFENSEGSTMSAASIVNLFQLKIDEIHLETIARGYCDSTCAFIFLMGHKRTLLPGKKGNQTILRLHPIRESIFNQFMTHPTNNYIRDISARSENRISKDLLMKMYQTTDWRGAVIIKRDAGDDGKHVFFQAKYGDKLEVLSDASLSELGISISD